MRGFTGIQRARLPFDADEGYVSHIIDIFQKDLLIIITQTTEINLKHNIEFTKNYKRLPVV